MNTPLQQAWLEAQAAADRAHEQEGEARAGSPKHFAAGAGRIKQLESDRARQLQKEANELYRQLEEAGEQI